LYFIKHIMRDDDGPCVASSYSLTKKKHLFHFILGIEVG